MRVNVPPVTVDLLLTDPPYNVAYQGATDEALTIQNDDMNESDFILFLSSAFENANNYMRNGAAFYIWHSNKKVFAFFKACEIIKLKIRQCLIWNKNSLVLGQEDYHWKHEPCFYGWKDGAAHSWYADRKQTTVLEFNKPARNGEHPTMKPVELIAYQMQNSTKKGDTVLDLFGGSGTTLIAAEQTGRRCRMLELDERYADVIVKRFESLTGQKGILL